MKWLTYCGAIGIALLTNTTVNAGWFSHDCGAEKSCGCTMDCQPDCCKPVICRPVCHNKFNYQRTCCKPVCCTQTAPACCAPTACAAPQTCCAPQACCNNGCCEGKMVCCDDCPYLIAHYIHKSQTACYAKHRAKAIDKLGDKFRCDCNPEVMCALIYALNDCDERVRGEAADEIGDQLRKVPCCCNQQVVCALSQALADCDRRVRREAEEALRVAGYDVEDCRNVCCTTCAPACGAGSVPAAAPAPAEDVSPPPAPPAEETAGRKLRSKFVRLAGLFR